MGVEQDQADLTVQRAIEARYLPQARAERREAQARFQEDHRPLASTAGWNTRATKADRQRDEAKATAETARATRLTKEDKALRKANAERERAWDHKRHATPATMAEANRPGRLAHLYRKGVIDAGQLAAACEIDDAYQTAARDVTSRTASFETRIDAGQRGDGTFFEALGVVRREQAYDNWRAIMARHAPIGAVLAMIVDDPLGYSVVAKQFGLSDRRAKALLLFALSLWPNCYADARQRISAADLAAAHARL